MNAELQALVDGMVATVTAATSVEDSATALVSQIPSLIDAAVQQAIQNGATAAELQPLSDLSATLAAKTQALNDAVVANTPQAPSGARRK